MVQPKTGRMRLAAAALLWALAGTAWAADYATPAQEVEAPIARVIALVSDVWVRDERYEKFRQDLSDKYTGTPPAEAFLRDEQWITVISSNSPEYRGIFKGRGTSAMNLRRGDIVEMTVRDYRKVKAYEELSTVTKVLCRRADPDYEACAAQNPLAWFDKNGERMVQP